MAFKNICGHFIPYFVQVRFQDINMSGENYFKSVALDVQEPITENEFATNIDTVRREYLTLFYYLIFSRRVRDDLTDFISSLLRLRMLLCPVFGRSIRKR